jgi:hypothetical protein
VAAGEVAVLVGDRSHALAGEQKIARGVAFEADTAKRREKQ